MASLVLPQALYGSHAMVSKAVRNIYAEVARGASLANACGKVAEIDPEQGWVVITGPDRLERQRALYRPHLLHDIAATRTERREFQSQLADELLELEWGGLCLVSQAAKGICKDRDRSRKLLAWALRWFDDLEAAGPIFGADQPFPYSPTFCRAPTTLWMVVVNPGGVPLEEIQNITSSETSREVRALLERAHANLAAGA